MKTAKLTRKLFMYLIVLSPLGLLAHGGEIHSVEKKVIVTQKPNKDQSLLTVYSSINNKYMKEIKPIFVKKCFDCHGTITKYPWYYKVLGIKQMMDYDMKEAKKHMDMSKDFPFISHETPMKDLKSLKEIGLKGSMPPLRYILGHWDASLSETEKQSLIKWSEESISSLKEVNK